MKIGIIGGGSIGLLISGYLNEKHTITLYVNREEQKKALASQPLKIEKLSVAWKETHVKAKQITTLNQEDCFIVCVKQSHIDYIIPYLKEIDKNIPIIFLQNGMGHLDKIEHLPQPIYVGVVEHGASRLNDTVVNHLGAGTIKLASFTGEKSELERLVTFLHEETFPFEETDDWKTALAEKLIVNAVINPLTALFSIKNGKIITNESVQLLAKKICEETAYVLKLDSELSWQRVKDTAINTKENTSSMLSDVRKGQKTEIEAISGYILKRATIESVPYTTFVYHSILALEKEGEYHR